MFCPVRHLKYQDLTLGFLKKDTAFHFASFAMRFHYFPSISSLESFANYLLYGILVQNN